MSLPLSIFLFFFFYFFFTAIKTFGEREISALQNIKIVVQNVPRPQQQRNKVLCNLYCMWMVKNTAFLFRSYIPSSWEQVLLKIGLIREDSIKRLYFACYADLPGLWGRWTRQQEHLEGQNSCDRNTWIPGLASRTFSLKTAHNYLLKQLSEKKRCSGKTS